MTEREMFEKEFTSSSLFMLDFGCSDRAFRKNVEGDYYYTSVQGAWEMWQESANREGYKLVPVKATDEQVKKAEQLYIVECMSIFDAVINAID